MAAGARSLLAFWIGGAGNPPRPVTAWTPVDDSQTPAPSWVAVDDTSSVTWTEVVT